MTDPLPAENPPPPRPLRQPKARAAFNRLPLQGLTLPPQGWYNLRWAKHATPENLFHASASARLTPASGKIPCLYLAASPRTCFEELYGDPCACQASLGRPYAVSRAELQQRLFLLVPVPHLIVFDLTDRANLGQLDLDLGTLYAPDIHAARLFAERLHGHPANFVGLRYESRHTREACLVLWPRPAIDFASCSPHGSLYDHLAPDPEDPTLVRLFDRRLLLTD